VNSPPADRKPKMTFCPQGVVKMKNPLKGWRIWEVAGFIVLGVLPIFSLSLWMWRFLSSDDFVGVGLCSIALAGWMAIALSLYEARKE